MVRVVSAACRYLPVHPCCNCFLLVVLLLLTHRVLLLFVPGRLKDPVKGFLSMYHTLGCNRIWYMAQFCGSLGPQHAVCPRSLSMGSLGWLLNALSGLSYKLHVFRTCRFWLQNA